MSFYRVIVYGLTCDQPGCSASEEFVPYIDDRRPLRSTRRALGPARKRPERWVQRGGQDFCPAHAGPKL